jgi:hypothetical protein
MTMIRNSYVRLLAIAALLLLPGALHAAQQEQPQSRTSVRYTIRFMDLHDAEVLAWDQCGKPAERCRVASLAISDASSKGYLEVLAEAAVHEKIARALAAQDALPLTQSFQVLLLSAGAKAGSSGLEIPPNAQKALADLKGFLPFKSYQLLDAVWMRATQDRLTTGRIAGRGADYQVRLRFRNLGNPKDRNLFVDTFSLMEQLPTPKPPAPETKAEEPVAPKPARTLIDTSFGLKGGETIVVGTSKVDGADEALVVLLTAVPSS